MEMVFALSWRWVGLGDGVELELEVTYSRMIQHTAYMLGNCLFVPVESSRIWLIRLG